MTQTLRIGDRIVGPGQPAYLIAELSANHHHDESKAVEMMHAAKEAGADAVKLQTYTADTLTIDCDNEHFRLSSGTLWDGRTLHDLYSEAYTPWEWQPRLKELGESLGLDVFSTPFDRTAIDFLEELSVSVYKIASFELVDLPLIRRVARLGKPMIMSTGMSSLAEIEEAVTTARAEGATEIALLKCSSAYPAPPSSINLRTIPVLAEAFQVVPGFSDHTLGIAVPVAAVGVGACIIEKHFTLDRGVPGPDSAFSLEPDEFRAMVDAIRTAEAALGGVRFAVTDAEAPSRVFRRSVFVVEDVKAGEPFTEANLRCIRPGNGLHTRHYDELIGRKAAGDIERGTPMAWALVR